MIISAGYRIGPFEVESALVAHPAVAEAAVVAAPDEERGAVVRAVVVLRDGFAPSAALAAELQDHVKAQTAPYKYPRVVDFAAELPRRRAGRSPGRARDHAASIPSHVEPRAPWTLGDKSALPSAARQSRAADRHRSLAPRRRCSRSARRRGWSSGRGAPASTSRAPRRDAGRRAVAVPEERPVAVYLERGEGARVWDVDGNEYLDFHNGFGVMCVGHANPTIAAAVKARMDEGTHFAAPTEGSIVVAEELKRRWGLPHWRFTNSGTESTMDAVHLARGAPAAT